MDLMRWFAGIAGLAVLVLVASSILGSLVVPRGLGSALVRVLWRSMRWVLRRTSAPFHSYEVRDRFLAWLAPAVLIAMLWSWLAGLLVAYGLLMHAVSGISWPDSFREAGSSLFTLGFASGKRSTLNPLDFIAAASGPVVIALQIAYLPTLYGAFNRREQEVTLLQSRASQPAWGPELLARQALVGTVDELRGLYEDWERLAADIGETHSNYPVLLSFRSPRPYRGWVVALIAVMDAAAMHISLAPSAAVVPAARLMLRSGFTALREIARVVRIPFDPDPDPDGPLRLTFEEYAEAVAHVQKAGFVTERSAEESWPHFRGWRVNYESIGYALARNLDAVPALWSGGRDFPHEPVAPQRPVDRRPQPSRDHPS
ncbi:hypothetical protein [Micromonospora sp. CB01531]|uniref:hypothetical protein n=1 Tax=Micromonospora sp. CB01531 TaxID=1718947 RepID=UPI00095B0BF2|nr:hypothetical protein [Micromonospora sp. CB01531]OKI67369.1 hypothetical protein A6A27_22950 [Micromonospora sp. CB01531]